MSVRIPRLLIILGALLVIIGAVFKLMHLGVGFLQAPILLGAGVTFIVVALIIIAISRLANK